MSPGQESDMPELPEVERVRRSLEPHLVGATIQGVWVFRADIVTPGPGSNRTAYDLLNSARVAELRRHGKHLAIVAEDRRAMVVHLGMTGQLTVRPSRAAITGDDHQHLAWGLEPAGARLVFRDPRRFGGVWTYRDEKYLRERWAELGPDAVDVTGRELFDGTRPGGRGSRRAIKAALLDQGLLAGVGNIYADEALFSARLHPRRRAGGLTADECERLAAELRAVLRRAIDAGGSTLRDFQDADGQPGGYRQQHAVYGRAGLPCPVCGAALKSVLLAQRTTVFCPSCQPARVRRAGSSSSHQR